MARTLLFETLSLLAICICDSAALAGNYSIEQRRCILQRLISNLSKDAASAQADRAKITVRKSRTSLRPTKSGFTELDFEPGFGFYPLENRNSNVGLMARVTFQPSERQAQTIEGLIINEYRMGLDIADSTGQIHSLNVRDGKFLGAEAKPSSVQWTKYKGIESIPTAKTKQATAIFYIKQNGKTNVVAGYVRTLQAEDGYQVLEVIDHFGTRHIIDPSYIHLDGFITKGRAQIPSIRPSERVLEFDKTHAIRGKLARDLATTKSGYENPELYGYFASRPEEARALIRRWYWQEASNLIEAVERNLGSKYVPLLVDPGIANRSKEFVSFGAKFLSRYPSSSLMQLREAFAAKLGTKRVFRGLMLSPDEYRYVMKNGIEAPGMRNGEVAAQKISKTLDSRYRVDGGASRPLDEIEMRVLNYGKSDNMAMSVTDHQLIAESVASSDSIPDPSKKLYVFQMDVPEIMLINKEHLFNQGPSDRTLVVNGSVRFNPNSDLGVERFVYYAIPRKYITGVKVPTRPSPTWQWE